MFALVAIESGCTAGSGDVPILESPFPPVSELGEVNEETSSPVNMGVESALGDPLVISHHWLALRAIENGDAQVATHHVEHVLELVTGSHVAQMNAALSDLHGGRLHEAGDRIKAMLAGTADPALSGYRMHLELALYSLKGSQVEDIQHHFEHLMTDAPRSTIVIIEGAMEYVMAGEFTLARSNIEQLLAESVDIDLAQGCIDPTRERPDSGELHISLLAEQGWIEEHGGTAVANFYLRRMGTVAAKSLAEIGITLHVSEYGSFSAQAEPSADLVSPTATGDVDLSVLLTLQALPGDTDAWLDRSGSQIVIENQNDDISAAALLLAHEIGHFYSLDHRTGTIMQPHGFPLVGIWSSCQRNFMREMMPQ